MNLRPDPVPILVVDDERAVRALIQEILQNAGYPVIAATCATEALQLYEEHQSAIRLLVTDVIMPGVSGAELAHYLLRSRPELPVLFVSGYCEDYRSAMHVFTCLAKPFTPAALIGKVRQLLESSQERSTVDERALEKPALVA